MTKSKVMNVLLSAVVVALVTVDCVKVFALDNKVTTAWERKDVKVYPRLKLGTNVVKVKASSQFGHSNEDNRRIEFKAPEKGTYQITFCDVKAAKYPYGSMFIKAIKKSTEIPSSDLKHSSKPAHVIATDWFESVYEFGNFTEVDKKAVNGNGVDSVSYTVKLKKGEKVKIKINSLSDMWETLYHYNDSKEDMSVKVDVSRL